MTLCPAMCGRFTLDQHADAVAAVFGVSPAPGLAPRWNVAPTQRVLAVRAAPAGREALAPRWGLLAPGRSAPLINARAETVFERAAFRGAVRRRRCLVPADGFLEWAPPSSPRGPRRPFRFRLASKGLMAFAGLWAPDDVEPGGRCAILTTRASALVAPVHDRMPVILPPAAFDLWLDPGVESGDALRPLFEPFPAEAMIAEAVSARVNDARRDDPECLAPGLEEEGPGARPHGQLSLALGGPGPRGPVRG